MSGTESGEWDRTAFFVPGQEIVTSEGVKNVEEVRAGDTVLTHHGRFRPVRRVVRSRYRGDAYRISLAGRYGRTPLLTARHLMLVRDRDGTARWLRPDEIEPGRPPGGKVGRRHWNSWACLPRLRSTDDEVGVLRHLPEGFSRAPAGGLMRTYADSRRADHFWPRIPSVLPLDARLGYLLGIYAAEGHLQVRDGELNGGLGFTFGLQEEDLVGRVKELLAGLGVETQIYRRADRGSQEVRGCSVPLAHLFRGLVGSRAKDKRVPACLLTGRTEAREGFLEGFLDGDGRSPRRPSNVTGRRDVKIASRSMAWGIRALLADAGHWVTVTSGTERGNFPQGRVDRLYRWYQVSYHPGRGYSRTEEDADRLYRPISGVERCRLERDLCGLVVEEDRSLAVDFAVGAG
ncbi:LAGLIDADG family homing endonuclease [Spirillospora sp. CA-253888]